MSSHPIGQKFVTPPTGLKVQPTYADGHSKILILQSSRTRSRRAGRHLMNALRQQFDRPNWRCRPISDIHNFEVDAAKRPSVGCDRIWAHPGLHEGGNAAGQDTLFQPLAA
jgi:hypothetical protein